MDFSLTKSADVLDESTTGNSDEFNFKFKNDFTRAF